MGKIKTIAWGSYAKNVEEKSNVLPLRKPSNLNIELAELVKRSAIKRKFSKNKTKALVEEALAYNF